ncbi:MAG: hypothetical protein NC340_05675 [Ruminococcus flavefaciens]|nr:hypothetical protein [Ruminococcus flavefaciens]MCM1230534.1 hypothetical protein [Ruminococcus flavefaciens]
MPDNKLSLEDILEEYSSDSENGTVPHIGRRDAQKIIISTLPSSKPPKKDDTPRPAVSHEKNDLFDTDDEENPEIQPNPRDLSLKKVVSAGSDGLSEVQLRQPERVIEERAGAGSTKIRRMSDSTRAREAGRKNKRKNRGSAKSNKTYSKETPDGEYMYTPPQFKKKKRTRNEILSEVEGEGRKYTTDIVPSPESVKPPKPAKPAPRAKKTSINLSSKRAMKPSELDIKIEPEKDDYEQSQYQTERTKRIVDFNYYGDVQDVGRDIYELKEIISARAVILGLIAFLSLYITVCSRFNFPIADFLSIKQIYSYLTAHLLLGLLAMFYSAPVISKGIANLFRLKADSDSMTAVTAITCLLSVVVAFFQPDMASGEVIHIYMPVGILSMLFNSLGKLLILKRAKRNFKFVSQNFDRHAVVYVKDEERAERLTRGTLGDFPILAAMRKTDFLTDFLRYSYSSDITDSFCRRAVPLCLIISIVISVLMTFVRTGTLLSVQSLAFGFSIFSMLICATCCMALPFTANIPLEKISKQTLRGKGILLGYQSVDDLYDTNSILVEADTIFPEGTVKLGGIKVFSNTKLPEALLDAASLTYNSGSVLQKLFDDIIIGREKLLYPIENFSYEEDMGLCGWINNRRILLGTRELMESHNIEGIPTKAQEAEHAGGGSPVYLSISGNLAAMFVVDLTTDRYIRRWADRLVKKKICIIIRSIDPLITREKVSEVFGIPQELIRILPKRLHDDFNEETKKTVRMSASMACTGRFTSMIQLILGIKVIHSSAITGLIVQTVSVLLGLVLSIMLIISKAFEFDYIYMSSTAMVIYNLIFTAVTCIAVNARKLK